MSRLFISLYLTTVQKISRMYTFIVADNQDLTKAGISFIINSMDLEVSNILSCENKSNLINSLINYPQSIIFLDYTLFDFTSPDELLILKERFKETYWILVSEELSLSFINYVYFKSDVIGIITKQSKNEEFVMAIRSALKKQKYTCSYITNLLLSTKVEQSNNSATDEYKLTPTEKAILKEISIGKTTKEIAAEKYLSFHTVNTHRKNIFRKLGVNNVHEATKYAIRAGIVDLTEYYI